MKGVLIMLKNVQIIEKSTGHLVVEYPLIIDGIEELTDEEYIEEAWELAVEESLVDEEIRDAYDIEIVMDIAPE
jgi:hypothetical protein